MADKNNTNNRVPKDTFTNKLLDGVEREYPSLACLTDPERTALNNRVSRLVDLETDARTPRKVVELLSYWLTSRPEFEERKLGEITKSTKKKYFYVDPWDGGSMIIVKEGERPMLEGFRMLLCHSDSPCLRIKPKPIRLEWDPDKIYHHLGVRLSAVGYGGISIHQWVGKQLKIIGQIVGKDGKRRNIELPGVVGDYAAHTDYRKEDNGNMPFPPESSLEIITGHSSVKETLERFGFDSMDDFAQSKLYGVPTEEPLLIDENSWRLLVGYGHDDRSCIFSAVDSIIKTRQPPYTSIIWITDREEVGDNAPTGVGGSFLDVVLDNLLEKDRKRRKSRSPNEVDRRNMFLNSSVIIADVNIAPYGHDAGNMDAESAPKIGLGVAISADQDDISSPQFLHELRRIVQRGSSHGQNICHQICGSFYSQDREEMWYQSDNSNTARLLSRIGRWSCAGIPCAASHSHNEIICPADELWTSRFYRRFLEDKTYIGRLDGKKVNHI